MKYLVVSDNHGDRAVLVELVATYRGKVDGMFHCGDSELEPTDPLWEALTVVRGNCDYDSLFELEQVGVYGTDTILVVHGHLANVRFSLDGLRSQAKNVGANIVFSGHTHELAAEVSDNILFVNPGSIRLPRGKYPLKTYAIVESTATHYSVSYYDQQHTPLLELSRTFTK